MRKSRSLVAQHLENISGEALENQELIRSYVYDKSGIYALYTNSKLYYVGLATNLNGRLMRHHLRDRHAGLWDRFSVYITQGDEHLREIEALVLRISLPKGNRQKGKLKRSDNLKKEFGRDMDDYYKRKRHNILTNETEEDEYKPIKMSVRDNTEGRLPTLAPYVRKRIHIRLEYKGNTYVAHVRRNGTITFGSESHRAKQLMGPVYTSPSLAARAITGKSNDGWLSWKYKNSAGEWERLNELRKHKKGYRK